MCDGICDLLVEAFVRCPELPKLLKSRFPGILIIVQALAIDRETLNEIVVEGAVSLTLVSSQRISNFRCNPRAFDPEKANR